MMAYLVRSMQAGGELAKTLWRTMIDNAEEYLEEGVRAGTLKPSRDPKARAKYPGDDRRRRLPAVPPDARRPHGSAGGAARLRPGHGAARARDLHRRPDDRLDTCTTPFSPAQAARQQGESDARLTTQHVADRVRGSGEELRDGARSRRPGPDGARGRGARLPRAQRRRASRRPSASCWAWCAPTAEPCGCSAATRGPTPSTCTARSPTCQAMSRCGRSLTGGETIDLLARMRGGIDEKRRAELIERFDLDPHKKARTYSKGNRQKVSLVSAFSSRARLLLLDEPSSGLDPLMENVFQQCVAEARDRGATVLLSSHILAETEALCERVTIIRAGKTVESGTLESMRHLQPHVDHGRLDRRPRRSRPYPRRRGRQLSTATRCTPRSTPKASASSSGRSATPACAAWSASRPRWRSSSCGTTAPTQRERESSERGMSRHAGTTHRPAHEAPQRSSAFTGTLGHASALPAPRPDRACRCGCCCCRCRWRRVYVGSIEKVYPDQAARAALRRDASWPARRSGRCTERSTTTASARPASGKPACSTC